MAGASKKTEDFTLSKDFDPSDLALICLVKKPILLFRFWESSLKETHPKYRMKTCSELTSSFQARNCETRLAGLEFYGWFFFSLRPCLDVEFHMR